MKKNLILSVLSVLTALTCQVSHADVTQALQRCLDRAIVYNYANYPGVKVDRVQVDGTFATTFGMKCDGDAALELFVALDFAPQTEKTWSTGRVVQTRFFGDRPTAKSSCNREVVDEFGRPSNNHWCYVMMDLSPDTSARLNF